jgi:hypothetical protein
MTDTPIELTRAAYLAAEQGDVEAALQLAVADLLDIHAEAELRQLALDQWVSRGYIQGSAAEHLRRQRRSRRSVIPGVVQR